MTKDRTRRWLYLGSAVVAASAVASVVVLGAGGPAMWPMLAPAGFAIGTAVIALWALAIGLSTSPKTRR